MPTKPRKQTPVAGTMDTYSNPVAGLGWGTRSINEATQYVHTALSQNYLLLLSLYRSHWICRKVIDAVPEDMLRKWISFRSQVEPQQVDAFERAVDDTSTVSQVLEALRWARLFGGSGALMVIDGQDNLEKPLDLNTVELGSYRGLLVFDRWSGIQGSLDTIQDLSRPSEFGLPKYYTLTSQNAPQTRVHHSRILRFIGRELPIWERQTVQGWGMSELELIYDELRKVDNTSWGIAQLVHRANLLVKTVPGLDQALSTGSAVQLQRLQGVIQAQMSTLNSQGVWMLNGGSPDEREELQAHQYSFGGLNDVYQSFLVGIAGACEIPYSRLFQRTVTGLSQTNEGDEQIYYDMIAQKQRRELRPKLRQLFGVIAKSTWGDIPDDLDFDFTPMQEMNVKEKAELGKVVAETVLSAHNAGLISPKVALQELRSSSGATGMWTSITDEAINAASDEVVAPELKLPGMEEEADGEQAVSAR